MRTTLPVTTKLGSYIRLVMLILDFGEILCATFFQNFGCVFFKVKHTIDHISGMAGPIDVKQKGGASVGFWVNYLTFTLDRDLNLKFFKAKFWNNCFSGIVGQMDVKWTESKSIRYWDDHMTLPFDHSHDIDLEISRSRFEIAYFRNGRADWHGRKGMLIDHSWP